MWYSNYKSNILNFWYCCHAEQYLGHCFIMNSWYFKTDVKYSSRLCNKYWIWNELSANIFHMERVPQARVSYEKYLHETSSISGLWHWYVSYPHCWESTLIQSMMHSIPYYPPNIYQNQYFSSNVPPLPPVSAFEST